MAMRFEHEFTVPVPVEEAWPVLLDVERIAPCLPGATLDAVEGGTAKGTEKGTAFTGRMRVKVGPITVTYRGQAAFDDVDEDARTLSLKASGKEARGAGTANAEVTARLAAEGGRTRVRVETSLNVTGRPAQFGRGVMAEVGGKIIDRFAANLAALLEGGREEAAHAKAGLGEAATEAERVASAVGAATGEAAQNGRHAHPDLHVVRSPWPEAAGSVDTLPEGGSRVYQTAEEEALDLLKVAGAPLMRRIAPVMGALAALAVVLYVVRRLLRR
ncbi:carbon monoxide dehydrogenase subunit G [Planotetraspora thailandica]|uniref:Carbon monoxide dehydrogenase subunit G n=1 Tax=Planotetraspora thailandica TaxID=487172 RepID=A0A8J3UYR9_9ACTN|nr:SRPBCC family protein [Planotetraspora thailandica]GII53125.1 carbon monoxide dehydrogenase subunit G [Planotetraspora thailandica]